LKYKIIKKKIYINRWNLRKSKNNKTKEKYENKFRLLNIWKPTGTNTIKEKYNINKQHLKYGLDNNGITREKSKKTLDYEINCKINKQKRKYKNQNGIKKTTTLHRH